MSDCCGTSHCENSENEQSSLPRKFPCPINAQQYVEVSKKTILQHIQSPWLHPLAEEKYYFCDDPDCDVVYFGLKGALIHKAELRTVVGAKEISDETLVCYCFGVTKAMANKDAELKSYVSQQTKEHNCACDIRNPSGRCCLKDFPKKH